MIEDRPSRTAQRVAMRRAVHQLWDFPRVLDDPVAIKIIGHHAAAEISGTRPSDSLPSVFLRMFLVVRSRYAEDQLAAAVAHGARQYVVLGAGLDTFAYRNPFQGVHVFEVDHPATQAWKRQRVQDAGIALPASLTFVPADFERDTLSEALTKAGFRKQEPAFFSWLGVTPYLARETVLATLRWIISACRHNGAAFDYAVPRESLNLISRIAFDALTSRVAAAGEPFVTFFDPEELARELLGMGFAEIDDIGADEINFRYFGDRADNLRVGGPARLVRARGDWPGS
ncbi:MAG TPA: class I SAM-dependent methyltransferase [Candidatus Angelobacter sp.]